MCNSSPPLDATSLPPQPPSSTPIPHVSSSSFRCSSSPFPACDHDTNGASAVAPTPAQHCEYMALPTAASLHQYIFINTQTLEPVKGLWNSQCGLIRRCNHMQFQRQLWSIGGTRDVVFLAVLASCRKKPSVRLKKCPRKPLISDWKVKCVADYC